MINYGFFAFFDFLIYEAEHDAWHGLAKVERKYRLFDRAACEEVSSRRWLSVKHSDKSWRAYQVGTPLVVTAAVLLALYVGFKAGVAAGVTP